jgi:hypothetical protein
MPSRNGCAPYFAFSNTRCHINDRIRPIRQFKLAKRTLSEWNAPHHLSTSGG